MMFVVRLRETPYVGDLGENDHKRGNSKLLVVLAFFHSIRA